MRIFKYETEEEAQKITQDMAAIGYELVEVSNITEGNFLGFEDSSKIVTKEISPTPIEEQIASLKEDNLILMDALATTFEEILNLQAQIGGTV